MKKNVILEKIENNIALIRINRPEALNALNIETKRVTTPKGIPVIMRISIKATISKLAVPISISLILIISCGLMKLPTYA